MTVRFEDLPKEDLFGPGNVGCKGCGAAIAGRQAMKALGSRSIVTVPASCFATMGGSNLKTTWKVPFYHTLFEMAPAVSSGIRAALEVQGIKDVNVISWAGDAGTADIGFQALTGAAERGDHMIHVCYDNEMYMNTSGQTGSQTPKWALTSNTAIGKPTKKKNMLAIMEAHDIDYVASASIAYPLDLIEKFKKAASKPGFSYIHILAPCHVGWQIPADQTVEIAKLAVESGMFELYEVDEGVRNRTYEPSLISVSDYIKPQGRFKHLTTEQIQEMQDMVNKFFGRKGGEV